MENFKLGDYVYFSLGQFHTNSGLIVGINNEFVSILSASCISYCIYKVKFKDIRKSADKELIIAEVIQHYNYQIEILKQQIKSIKKYFYQNEIKNKYELLQTEILNTAKHMINFEDDTDFENKLKAICEKKKQLFSIECEDVSRARKFNGDIRYKIKELIIQRDQLIKNIDASIEKLKKELTEYR